MEGLKRVCEYPKNRNMFPNYKVFLENYPSSFGRSVEAQTRAIVNPFIPK